MMIFWSLGAVRAQEMHRIQYGKIGISIFYNDTLINIGSNKLIVVINDQTGGIVIRLDPTTLRTGIDSLDLRLNKGNLQEVVFKGEVDLDKLWETKDTERYFEIEGELTINGETRVVSFHGNLRESQQGMDINGLLYLHFDPLLVDFGLEAVLPQFAEHGCVEILQPLHIANNRH